jgi:hypothetical protein
VCQGVLSYWYKEKFEDNKGVIQGRIQDFKLVGAQLKKLRQVEGGTEIFGVFRVKNHDFTPKNHNNK